MGFTKCVGFFSLFFDSILDFSVVFGGVRGKVNSAFDRARRVLSWSLLLRLWSPLCANPDPGYPTSFWDVHAWDIHLNVIILMALSPTVGIHSVLDIRWAEKYIALYMGITCAFLLDSWTSTVFDVITISVRLGIEAIYTEV